MLLLDLVALERVRLVGITVGLAIVTTDVLSICCRPSC